jgi:hypothetical protein
MSMRTTHATIVNCSSNFSLFTFYIFTFRGFSGFRGYTLGLALKETSEQDVPAKAVIQYLTDSAHTGFPLSRE